MVVVFRLGRTIVVVAASPRGFVNLRERYRENLRPLQRLIAHCTWGQRLSNRATDQRF
jgi:hypothetical protein